jgi:hypothetical protein
MHDVFDKVDICTSTTVRLPYFAGLFCHGRIKFTANSLKEQIKLSHSHRQVACKMHSNVGRLLQTLRHGS